MPMGPRTYCGVLHVHTVRGGDEGTMEDVLRAASSAGVQFVVLTDRQTRGYGVEGLEGWQDGVLVLCGEEVCTPESGFLAFEHREDIGKVSTTAEAMESLRRQCGVSVGIHHEMAQHRDCPQWMRDRVLPMSDVDLLEVWNFTDEFLTRATPKYVVQQIKRADKVVASPSRAVIRRWDRELQKRMLPIVGGLDVSPRKSPLLEWEVMFPYDLAFRTICTYVQTLELPSVALRARDLIWNALREGRSYVANRVLGNGEGFAFEYHSDVGRIRSMGDSVAYSREGRFFIRVPQEAEVVLRHNGQPLFWSTAKETTFCNAGPGAYRVEVYLNRRLWILSNPIRLVDEEGTLQPTVSDVT